MTLFATLHVTLHVTLGWVAGNATLWTARATSASFSSCYSGRRRGPLQATGALKGGHRQPLIKDRGSDGDDEDGQEGDGPDDEEGYLIEVAQEWAEGRTAEVRGRRRQREARVVQE